MDAEEPGIIGGPGRLDPAPAGALTPPARPLLEVLLLEGAWLLFLLALTVFLAGVVQAAGGRLRGAATGVALFSFHGLVGAHVVRTERGRLRSWLAVDRRSLALGVLGGAALLAINALYALALSRLGVEPPDVVPMLRDAMPGSLVALWAGLLAPVVEELYFRGRLLALLDPRLGTVLSAGISSALFAGLHGIPEYLPVYLGMGLVLVALRRRTGGLAAPILAHIVNNAVALHG